MRDSDWEQIDGLLENWWSQPWDSTRSEAYRAALARFTPAEILAALGRLLERGLTFRPSASEIVRECAGGEMNSPPAWAAVQHALGTHPAFRQLPRPEYDDEKNAELALAVAEALLEIHPAVADLVTSIGLDQFRLAPLDPRHPLPEGEDGIGGRVVLARLKDAYDSSVSRWEGGHARRLDAAGVAAALLQSGGAGGMEELVDRLRPAEALPSPVSE